MSRAEQDMSTLSRIILNLPLRERQIFYLSHYEDLSISEISDVLEMREDHVSILLDWATSKIVLVAKKSGLEMEEL